MSLDWTALRHCRARIPFRASSRRSKPHEASPPCGGTPAPGSAFDRPPPETVVIVQASWLSSQSRRVEEIE